MKKYFYTLIIGSLMFGSCTNSNMESTAFGGLTIVHPKKSLPQYAQCNVPALGNYFAELMKMQGLEQLAIQTKSFGSVVIVWFPVQPQAIGNAMVESEFAQAVANTKQKVYNNQNEVFFMLCDQSFNGQKLIGDCGVLMYENGKNIDISQIDISHGYVIDCWDNLLYYKTQSGKERDEAGDKLSYTLPQSICLPKYKDYKSSIYAANTNSLYEFVLAHISIEGQKHDNYVCLSYYFNAGATDYLANLKTKGVNSVVEKKTNKTKNHFILTSVNRIFEDELSVVFTKMPTKEIFDFKITASELNKIKPGLIEEIDGEIILSNKAKNKEYTIAYKNIDQEDENTGEMKKVQILTYISEQ